MSTQQASVTPGRAKFLILRAHDGKIIVCRDIPATHSKPAFEADLPVVEIPLDTTGIEAFECLAELLVSCNIRLPEILELFQHAPRIYSEGI
jgi:hypothetical protein